VDLPIQKKAREAQNKNMDTPISKSQKRAMSLLNLAAVDDYASAAAALEAAGCSRDGIPAGQTWRTAANLSDAVLLAGLQREEETPRISRAAIIEYGY
jgi:hypothetical protein